MIRRTAFALIVALPGLVTADFYRLRPSPDTAQPDALPWNTRIQRPEPTAVHSALPSWARITSSDPAGLFRSRAACPGVVPQHLGRCLSQPDCRRSVHVPILWPHSPRADEQKTAAEEMRTVQVQVEDKHTAN